jgi:hypothetical protein
MLIPTNKIKDSNQESGENKSDNSENNGKKSFYEVGCKIFEINKIYK